jgi:hypothetical protein
VGVDKIACMLRGSCSIVLVAAALLTGACASLPAKLERALQAGRPVEGDIHGAFADLEQYVFTYRDGDDFFEFVEVSLIATTPEVAATLAGLRRHDRVKVQGTLADNRSQQLHVEVRSLEVVSRYEAAPAIPAYEHAVGIPDDLIGKDSELFLVHAVDANGAVLVVERGDVVLPVFVRRPELTRDLARNDLVRLYYEIRSRPDRPVHLELADVGQPVQVVDSISERHGRLADLEGALVLFPQSPQVRFNVFAVLEPLAGGAQRQFTLVNFDDAAKFASIRAKLQAAWDSAGPDAAVSGRNKLISTKVRVRVKGTYNQIDPNQANAQIVLEGPEALEIVAP